MAQQPVAADAIKASPLGQEVCRRALTDLFFFAKYFEGFEGKKNDKITEETHRRVCDFFVKKDNRHTIEEQDYFKERLLLYPRGSFKTLIDRCDAAQWVLNFPNIRILFLTATKDLAIGILDELKGMFVFRTPEPSFMNIFFPEFCVTEHDLGKMDMFRFVSPMYKGGLRKEATVMANSIESSMSGFHYEVIKPDDMVSVPNSETEDQCKKVIKTFNINRKMLMSFGYLDFIGTRYHDMDIYGQMLEKNVGEIKRDSAPCWERFKNETAASLYLIGIAWKPKTGFEGKRITELEPDQVHLLFPEMLSYAFLRQDYIRDEDSHESQYLQNPRPKSEVDFDKPMLLKHTVPYNNIPYNGPIVQVWDFAFSKKKGRDYSTGVCAIFDDQGRLYIVDLVRNRFKHTELAKAIVDLAERWKYPAMIGIEDAAGSRNLEPVILIEAKHRNNQDLYDVLKRIDWFPPDQQKDAKKQRMRALHPWLMMDRLWFYNSLPHLSTLYDEFERCLVSHHHDDIPDVVSMIPRYAPRIQVAMQKGEIRTWNAEEADWNLYFEEGTDQFGRIGMRGFDTPPAPQPIIETGLPSEVPAPGFEPVLGSGLTG